MSKRIFDFGRRQGRINLDVEQLRRQQEEALREMTLSQYGSQLSSNERYYREALERVKRQRDDLYGDLKNVCAEVERLKRELVRLQTTGPCFIPVDLRCRRVPRYCDGECCQ